MDDKRDIFANLMAGDPKPGVPVLPPLSGLIELAILVAAISSITWLFPDLEISDIQPNPFWLPVLLLSLQYGTVSGVLAAGVALLVTVASGLPEEGVGENHFSYALRVYSQPILWFAAAVLLGQFRMRQISAKEALRQQLVDISEEREALSGYASSLRARLESLERGRAGESDVPAVRLLNRIDELRNTGRGHDIGPAFAKAMECALPGIAASVFCVTTKGLEKVASVGWPSNARWASELPAAHALYKAVITDGACLTVLDRGDDLTLSGEGLVAVPIGPREPGAPVVGLVKIEKLDPAALTEEIVPVLQLVASLLSQRLGPGVQRPAAPPAAIPEPVRPPANLRTIRWKPNAVAQETAQLPDAVVDTPDQTVPKPAVVR